MTFSIGQDGAVRADFTPDEKSLIASLAEQVVDLLGDRHTTRNDPAIVRLVPNAYPDDRAANAEFRRFTEDDLVKRKFANAAAVRATLERPGTTIELDAADVQAWLRTLTDIRLTIATRLGIETDEDEGDVSTDKQAALHEVYDWLGYVLELLVRAVDR